VFPWDLIDHVGVSPSIYLKLISREIIFEVLQPMWSRYLNVMDRRTLGVHRSRFVELYIKAPKSEKQLKKSNSASDHFFGNFRLYIAK